MSDEIVIKKKTILIIGFIGALASIASLTLYFFDIGRPAGISTDTTIQNHGDGNRNIVGNGNISEVRGDVIINPKSKYEFVSGHDGAGAPILTKPSFKLHIQAASKPIPDLLGRLEDGTGLKILEKATDIGGTVVPFTKVRVLEGDMKGVEGWTLTKCVRRPM